MLHHLPRSALRAYLGSESLKVLEAQVQRCAEDESGASVQNANSLECAVLPHSSRLER